jgi:3-deoxy-D-manno-octulosonic acid kinase
MPNEHQFWDKNQCIWFDFDLLPDLSQEYFSGSYWQSVNQLVGRSVGRGTTYFFQQNGKEFVLRHYLRGGLIGKLIDDHYVYTGINGTRAVREKQLLQHLISLQLPVPTPAATRIIKKGLVYQADLITLKIANAIDAYHILQQTPLSADMWHKIGATIARFHQQQIYHHDLNIHNIMIDDQDKVWLIDFDKCCVKNGDGWKSENLDRLQRSLRKESMQNGSYAFSEANWKALTAGYTNQT